MQPNPKNTLILEDLLKNTAEARAIPQSHNLIATPIETPLGLMLAIADKHKLYLLEFIDTKGIENEIRRLQSKTKASITLGSTEPLAFIQEELQAYFKGELKIFKTPMHFLGSSFQQKTWQGLLSIPYAETRSYSEQAQCIGKPTACRAVANANGANQLAIIVPCHRIIQQNGKLGGYAGGIARKQWLINHEQRFR